MSSIIGQRSGNRGKCAQPCRLPYELLVKDINSNIFPNVTKGTDATKGNVPNGTRRRNFKW